ncbi:MAG TPA: DHA2 family efflux MFS transporter permease subunit [Candidatus Methylacidiphilales bacterium]|jgi:DHA2 family multidrug resistance protein|nr:DHA2 family efflux MFS transporter permease subunit [Candidatus Methylacidiphilales bacterium]
MEKVTCRQWFAVVGAMLGAFMAVLDIQITNSSLNDIAGALGCSLDEGSWISTSYLVAEIVVIGMTGFLARVFSIKRYLLFSVVTFVIFSMFCAFAQNLNMMIIGRALQGLTGGALIPLAMTVNILILPPSLRPVGNAIFAMTATFAPAIGPTIGGWLTDNYGWQWIFFINIFPGVLMFFLLFNYLECDERRPELLAEGDYIGIFCMALGLGSLEYVLEEGERKDWFGNPLIRNFAIVAAIFITLFLIRELTTEKPFVNLRVFRHLRFTLSTLILAALGLALYGTVYLIPVYLAQIQGYSPFQIGITLMWVGLPQLVLLPFVPKLMKIIDPRIVAGIGLALFGGSCIIDGFLSPDFAMDQFRFSNIIRALGQPLIFVPLLSMSTEGIPRSEAGSASALFNMSRNIGGSVGIAMLSTIVTQREHLHSVHLGEFVTAYTPSVQARLDFLRKLFESKGIDAGTANGYALAALNRSVQNNAYIMAYSDAFLVIGAALILAIGGLFFMPKSISSGAMPMEH